MATITPTVWRSRLRQRMRDIKAVQDWTDAQLDEAGQAAFAAAFPHLHKVTETLNVPVVDGRVTVTNARRVYELWNADRSCGEQPVVDWSVVNDTTIRGVPWWVQAVDVYAYEPVSYPTTSVDVPDEIVDALFLYAQAHLIEQLLGDRSQFTGYQPNTDMDVAESELQRTADYLYQRAKTELEEHGRSVPMRRV